MYHFMLITLHIGLFMESFLCVSLNVHRTEFTFRSKSQTFITSRNIICNKSIFCMMLNLFKEITKILSELHITITVTHSR